MTPGQARPSDPAQACRIIAVETTPAPALDTMNDKSGKDLLGVCRSVIEGSTELIKFVDQNRDAARNAGVETIAIELSGLLEGGAIARVRDTLEEATVKNWPAQVTHEGLAKVRRAEALLADATREMDKELGVKRNSLGQADEGITWWPFVLVGAAAAVGAFFLVSHEAPSVAVPQYSKSAKKAKALSGSDSKKKK
jgi:hypothetical protein